MSDVPSVLRYETRSLLGWDGFVLERHKLPAGSMVATALPHHCLAIPRTPKTVPIRWHWKGRRIDGTAAFNRIYFRATGDELAGAWSEPLDTLFLAVSPDVTTVVFDEALRQNPVLQTDLTGGNDFGLLQLVLKLDACLRGHPVGGRLFEQSLLLACGLRLASVYAATDPRPAGKLPRRALIRLDDFILSHLSEPLTLDAIAAAVNLSTYHLCRAFRETRQTSLWQYVLMCRIAYGRRLMARCPDMPLSEVAASSGFDSYPQFFAAFRKFCHAAPRDFRKRLAGNPGGGGGQQSTSFREQGVRPRTSTFHKVPK